MGFRVDIGTGHEQLLENTDISVERGEMSRGPAVC